MADDLLDDYRRLLLTQYRSQVTAYAGHLAGLGDRAIRLPIKPGEWSAHQVLFHVVSVDENAYGPRLRRILREHRPALEDYDGDGWMAAHYDPNEPSGVLLDRWRNAREGYAAELGAAPAEGWSRTGLQPFWGERTLQWWVERAVAHAEEHWRQLQGE
jgi:DinB superfamily